MSARVKSTREQLRNIKESIGLLGGEFAKQLARQASRDMQDLHTEIVRQFYDSYDPNRYNRSYGLYNSLIPQPVIQTGNKEYEGKIVVGSFGMEDYYGPGATPDNVFDLMWNKGVRGLPHHGAHPLNKTYNWQGITFHEGERWFNPYWSGQDDPYRNLFRAHISMGAFETEGTPHQVMKDFVFHWKFASGLEACDRIYRQLKNKK